MNSKKSIVLLITLFFIFAISILILQNLKDTDKFLDEISFDNSLSQIQVTIDNVSKEIPKFFKKNKDNIDEILENSHTVPFVFGDVEIMLSIQDYTLPLFNINKLDTATTSHEDFVNNVNYIYDFLNLVDTNKKEYGNYTTNSQIQQTIQTYIKLTKDKDILNIKDDFTYIDDTNISQLIECDYILKVNEVNCNVSFIFDLNNSNVKTFNIISIF